MRRSTGIDNPHIELILYHNRVQLATRDVLYSDGNKYIPATEVCRHFRKQLPDIKSVLVLGTGLASIMHVLNRKGYFPDYTFVEKDKTVLQWAMEFSGRAPKSKIEPVCDDAAIFMRRNTTRYSFVFIDIFNSKTVPEFVIAESFLRRCRDSMAPGGHLAFNYIVNDSAEWEEVQRVFNDVFPGYEVISRDVNKILVV